ncbi:MAG: DUF433 domain-containing protein [Timaviella obliquedivisa GSE-PSE-MK23-08B]|jgi:uncharacterized protein (DUF433 family)|nr:DUF433 domain-containing protein [Timaviella obliquedivisa GSE-PSE-MK23-08B]
MAFAATEHKYVQLNERHVPIISGTTMKVIEIIEAQQAYGWSPEEIHFQHPYLTMSQIYSALAYYWDHKQKLDSDIQQRLEHTEQLRQQSGISALAEQLRKNGRLP